MSKFSKVTPEGTKDYLFDECLARRKIESALANLFKSCGYKKVITPTLEFFDVYDRESSGISQEDLFVLSDSRGRLMALRADNTLPIARITATRLQYTEPPVRLYYTQQVFKRCKTYSGHSNETSQSGIELIGAGGYKADMEILTMAFDALESCQAPDYRIEIGHAGYFRELISKLKADDATKELIAEYIETKNCIVLNEILDKMGDSKVISAIRKIPKLFGGEEILDEALALYSGHEAKAAIEYIRRIFNSLKELGLDKKIDIDLSLVHRNNYYTGIVFRGYIEGSGLIALSGGRYDNLIGEFGKDMPATGFGVDINALSKAMLKRGDVEKIPAPEILIFSEEGFEAKGIAYAKELRAKGITCEYSVAQTFEEAKAYAEKMGINKIEIINEK